MANYANLIFFQCNLQTQINFMWEILLNFLYFQEAVEIYLNWGG